MHEKSFRPTTKGSRHSTGWLRAMREMGSEPDNYNFKDARRLSSVFGWLDSWDRKPDIFRSGSRRNWKAHSKCRHQWEKHECPDVHNGNSSYWLPNEIIIDHNRKWILDCIREKKTCIFDFTHSDLDAVLDELCYEGICEYERLSDTIFKVTLTPQKPNAPGKKTSPGDKRPKSGKYVRRKYQRAKMVRINQSIGEVAERKRRARRHTRNGLAATPLSTELLVPLSLSEKKRREQPMTAFDMLCKDAKSHHIKGITRGNAFCLNLLQNYSRYRNNSKTRIGLAPYEHNFHHFTNAVEQCCVWLTGRRPCDFPPWVFGMLYSSTLEFECVYRLLDWTLGQTSVRDRYGLSKNEAREIVQLPMSIESEKQAIIAAIARARHTDGRLTDNLIQTTSRYGDIFCENTRDFIRNVVAWLNVLPVPPSREKLHDLMDFFFLSGLSENAQFSFKGRTLHGVEQLMLQWHEQERLRKIRNLQNMTWRKRGYEYNFKDYYFFELASAAELMEEGIAQRNCVFSYRYSCASERTSIVSMQHLYTREHVTMEIDNVQRAIVQIRETCNRLPSTLEMRIIRQFASVKNLSILDRYVR